MRRVLLWLSWIFGAIYVMALTIFAIGVFGLFGVEPDPLAGIFLIPLGLPWTFLADWLPDGTRPLAAIFAPLVNLLLLLWGAGRIGRRRGVS